MSGPTPAEGFEEITADGSAEKPTWRFPRTFWTGNAAELCDLLIRCRRFVLSFQFIQVTHQFVFAGPADEVETDHLVGAERRLAAGPQADQQAGDDGTIGLNLNAVLLAAQQTPAAEDVFEESEKYLNNN